MKVLLLTPYTTKLTPALYSQGDTYIQSMDPIDLDFIRDNHIDFIVSYGYRHLINKDIISLLECKVINLHISMLPCSRGAHPNFWSIVEGRNIGVTIHHVNTGLDTGKIIIQQEIAIDIFEDTFRSSYEKLSKSIERLFFLNWKYLRTGSFSGWEQLGKSSYHRASELESLKCFLPLGWDTPIKTYFRLSPPDFKIISPDGAVDE